jgi:antitoxin component YwqK of YwqJK toxin-antitoxin module
MPRVNWDDLDEWEYCTKYEGKPFTGQATEFWPNGVLLSETEFVDGHQEGPSREWTKEGVLIAEENLRNGRLQGMFREWYPNGRPKKEGEYEWGVRLQEREWDEDGRLTKDYKLDESDPNYETIQKQRAWHAARALRSDDARVKDEGGGS